MKLYVCFALFVVLSSALVQAEKSPLEESYYKLAEVVETALKKYTELTGNYVEFDKEKVWKWWESNTKKLRETYDDLIKKYEKDSKHFPEELKKYVDTWSENVKAQLQALTNSETKMKWDKLVETTYASMKKITDHVTEVGKSIGFDVPPSIQKTLGEIGDIIQKSGHKIGDQVQRAAEEFQKELKKKN